MPKTIRELAKELNCSYEAVRKQTKRYAKELKEHIYTQHKTQYLDDYACDFIRSKRTESPVVYSRMEQDEAVELLKQKYVELLEAHNVLKDEHRALELKAAELQGPRAQLEAAEKEKTILEGFIHDAKTEIDTLNADNVDLRRENVEKDKILEDERKNAQKANMELSEALESERAYAAALEEWTKLPWYRRRQKDKPQRAEKK